ncbi:MAG TPA: Rv3654c family TadE-like protein [Nocardioidaceae bacterium]|nr:Rv3654c family TadE-like protein [Nocardioidaceae bacterium]
MTTDAGRSGSPIDVRVARRDERGVATVLAIGWIVVLTTVGWVGTLAATVAAAQHHADGAADLAALAAAGTAQSSRVERCAAAARVARANAVTLSRCQPDGLDVVVIVADEVELPWDIDGEITATARAGP